MNIKKYIFEHKLPTKPPLISSSGSKLKATATSDYFCLKCLCVRLMMTFTKH